MERSGILAGTEPVDPALIEPFLTEMRERVIPEIVRTMEARAEARWRQMFETERELHNAWRKRAEEAEKREADRDDANLTRELFE